uniref:Retinoic acid receptor responder protein 1 n=1 Tax=Geotrypetes seraphini TaxID=260995 RepID=A0A6P8SAR1_GEOSA|nr:retinoic acid receptor responder protein 1 [Geotrypetes seraphini]
MLPPRAQVMRWRVSSLLAFILTSLQSARGGSLPISTRELVPSDRSAQQAARVTVHYLNYGFGSPHKLLVLGEVKQATRKDIPGIGHRYSVQFTTKDFQSNEKVGICFSSVFFQMKKPRPIINLNCTNSKIRKQEREDDYNFYKDMKQRTEPVMGKDIPDSKGYVHPDFVPLWHLAIAGSSYVMWEKSEEHLRYNMAQIKSVKQRIRKDDLLDFDYNVLLHEIPTQEMVPCHVRILWHPEQPMKVKYYCSPMPHFEEEGSGTEANEGSGSYGNF